jgi:hypothetical protein
MFLGDTMEFKNTNEFNTYINDNKSSILGHGVEGTVYLTKSNETIKDIQENPKIIDYTNVIMSTDLDLSSFLFPTELFLIGNKIVGYKSNYFPNNIIKKRNGKIEDIDIDALLEAREKFIKDLKVLTESGYYLYDTAGNILFDNKSLVAIDTLNYKKKNVPLRRNISALDNALVCELKNHDSNSGIDVFDTFSTAIQKIKK